MKQQSFFKNNENAKNQSKRKEHGGALSDRKRRSKRILSMKDPIHLTLRSDFAYGVRSLMKHRDLIRHMILKFSRRFKIKVYRHAICGNHIHLLIKGENRVGLQNFFRVLAGHIAQNILKQFPVTLSDRKHREFMLSKKRGGAPQNHITSKKNTKNTAKKPTGCRKNQRQFWALLVYTRIITWGREFKSVSRYILQNTLEALQLIAYKPRKNHEKHIGSSSRA